MELPASPLSMPGSGIFFSSRGITMKDGKTDWNFFPQAVKENKSIETDS